MKHFVYPAFLLIFIMITSCKKEDVSLRQSLSDEYVSAKSGGSSINLTLGLIAYYPFNGNANDLSGNGYHGIVTGATPTADHKGKKNGAYAMNGAINNEQYIEVSNFNYDFGNKISIALWAKVASDNIGEFCNRRVNNSIDFSATITNNGQYPYIEFGSLGQGIGVTTTTFNKWYHYTFTYDGSTIKVYLNGVIDKTVSATGNIGKYSSILNFGKYVYNNAYYYYFHGAIEEVRFYNRALAQAEVTYLAKQ